MAARTRFIASQRRLGLPLVLARQPKALEVRLWTRRFSAARRALTAQERGFLSNAGFDGPRRAEWVRGRVAAHHLLPAGASVLSSTSGAPRVVGTRGGSRSVSVSLSHEGQALAVAARVGGPVAVDVVPIAHAARLARVLERLRPRGAAAANPARAWAALECALKLRGRSITTVLGLRLGLWRRGDDILVTGVGPTVRVRFASAAGVGALVVAVAW
ncbi:MAG: hypothetical protein IPI49_02690 [Myxococcales bacterium]|nr:hypothetical protein [Myxococcales bacterium]